MLSLIEPLPESMARCARRAWAAPASMCGGLLALAAPGARWRWVDGVVEIHGGLDSKRPLWRLMRRFDIEALTLGHVVLARTEVQMSRWRAHERVHVQQYERWGVFLLIAYPASSLWQRLRGRCPYRMNHFERAAFRADEGAQAGRIKASIP